jgi:hypothetical protein
MILWTAPTGCGTTGTHSVAVDTRWIGALVWLPDTASYLSALTNRARRRPTHLCRRCVDLGVPTPECNTRTKCGFARPRRSTGTGTSGIPWPCRCVRWDPDHLPRHAPARPGQVSRFSAGGARTSTERPYRRSQSRASRTALRLGVRGLGPDAWRQHQPLLGEGWRASIGWPLTMPAGICGNNGRWLDRREDRRWSYRWALKGSATAGPAAVHLPRTTASGCGCRLVGAVGHAHRRACRPI